MATIDKAKAEFKAMMEKKVGREITDSEVSAGWKAFIDGINQAEEVIRKMSDNQ